MFGRWQSKRISSCAVAVTLIAGVCLIGCGSSGGPADRGVTVVAISPANGSTSRADEIPVRGTVTPANAEVQIQGQPAAVGNGVFTGRAHLHSGKTSIDIIASAPGTAPGSATISVTLATKKAVGASRKGPGPTKTVTAAAPIPPSPGVTATSTWPAATSGWTVILGSVGSQAEATHLLTRAVQAGLPEPGILLSSEHSSLRAGYWVTFTGVLSHESALARQQAARAAGFSDAYARYVSAG